MYRKNISAAIKALWTTGFYWRLQLLTYETERLPDVSSAGPVVDFRHLHRLVANDARDHNWVLSTAPHHTNQGLAEIMPAPDDDANGCRCRMQVATAGIAEIDRRSFTGMERPLMAHTQCS